MDSGEMRHPCARPMHSIAATAVEAFSIWYIAQEGNVQVVGAEKSVHRELLAVEVRSLGFPGHVASDEYRVGSRPVACVENRGEGFGPLRRDHRRGPRLDYAGLVRGYLSDGIAKDLGMVHAHRSNDAHLGVHNVGGVEPSAQSNLDGLDINRGGRKTVKGHAREKLEQRYGTLLPHVPQGPEVTHQCGELLAGNGLAVPSHPFPKGVQMRRGVEARGHARMVKGGVAEGGGAPLALGSRYVHRRDAPVWTADLLEKGLHPTQVVDGLLARPINPGALGIEQGKHVCNCFVVPQHAPRRRA